MKCAALDIGGTRIKACLFSHGAPVAKGEADTAVWEGVPAVLARAAALLEEYAPFDAVGISSCGQIDPARGVVTYANHNFPGYTGTDLKAYFRGRFGVPAAVRNDVTAAALGEYHFGAAAGQDCACLTFGTGVNGGIILDGKPYSGKGPSFGGMLGGLWLDRNLEKGTFEDLASTSALVAAAKALDPALTDGRSIIRRMEEPAVADLLRRWMDTVALGVVSVIHAFNVPLVILGGGIMEQEAVISGVLDAVHRRLIPGFQGVRLAAAALGNMAGLYGAYAAICEELQ